MSSKSQLFLSSSYQRIGRTLSCPAANFNDVKLKNPWIDYDSTVRPGLAPSRIKWSAVWGIGLATALSASMWTGIVFAVSRIWR
jgi:hypothetical protein